VRDESGFTFMEMLVTMAAGTIVTSIVVMITSVALHNQDRIARRVDANQRGRPVMTRMIQELHSACVAPRIAPILSGGTSGATSTGSSISFLSQPGSAVSPTPDKHVITLSGTTLSESVYPAISGTAPGPWTFSPTASLTRQLLTNVTAPSGVMFRYFAFVNGQLSTTSLPTSPSLSATDAAHTAIVSISFASSPTGGASNFDPNSPISFTDSADLRLEAAGQYPNQDNLPCV
jgi:prepilin-type N-terminal cleavage/methylation domain-containing protein